LTRKHQLRPGFAYRKLKKYNLSAENYEKAVKLGVKDPILRHHLADTYEKLGMRKKAIACVCKNISTDQRSMSNLADSI